MTRLRTSLLILLSSLWLATAAHAYPADQCAADRYGANLGCTAGDVAITGMSVVGDTSSCVGGTNITLDLQMTVNFAVPNRWDIGIFISNDGKDPQLMAASGGAATCAVSVLPTTSPFLNLDGGTTGDTCGDGNGTIGGGTGSGIHYMPQVTVPCQSLAGAGGSLYIPFVVSWDNQSTPPGNVCTSNLDPVPNTKSKCNAPTVVQGSIAVVVLPTITMTDNITTLFSGDNTSYLVTITNTTGADLSNVVFTDPAAAGITANSVICSAAGGASCPVSSTVAAMQGAGITLPTIPTGGSLTFTIGATLTGTPGVDLTNTAHVTVGGQTNSASDTNTIVDTIAILPVTQSKSSDKNSTVTYSYTLYNFGTTSDTISLTTLSSLGWTATPSSSSVTIAAGGSAVVTVSVQVPSNATIGQVDTTSLIATSGINPAKTATATAVTSVTQVLTLIPSNTGGAGAGTSIYYTHRVQSNASSSKFVSLTPAFSAGTCTGWSSALFAIDKITPLTSPVTLAANGGYKDFVVKITLPSSALANDTCTATLTAAFSPGAGSAVSVTDITTVKSLVLYNDAGYTKESYVYPTGSYVFAKGTGLVSTSHYEYRWYDSNGSEVCTPRLPSTTGTIFPDTCLIPSSGLLGTWTVKIWNTDTNLLFASRDFYVGPDHLQASYSGTNPTVNTDTVINLALHDKTHMVPFDSSGNLVKGGPTDPEDPLMVTVKVSGSATIVSTNLINAVITGQSVTGRLSSTTGVASLTIRDIVAETVTVTPSSYRGVLYGSPTRDEPAVVTFELATGVNHYTITHAGTSITCDYLAVTISAYSSTDESATMAPVSGTKIHLTTSTTVEGWYTLSGSTYTKLTNSDYTFDGTVTSVTLYLKNITASANIDIDVLDNTGAKEIDTGISTTNDRWATFVTSMLQFVTGTSGGALTTVINNQIGGKPSSTAPDNQNIFLRAVKTDLITGACVGSLTGTNTVNLGYQCLDPASCSANQLSLTPQITYSGTATTIPSNNGATTTNTTGVSLTFDANGLAPLSFIYANVGKIALYAGDLTLTGGATITGSASSPFIEKPQAIIATASGTTPYKAGVGGPVTIKAVLWDSNNTNLADNPVATQFGQETAPTLLFDYSTTETNSGNVSVQRGATTSSVPLASTATTLSFPLNNSDFTSGVTTLTLNWDEVGSLTLNTAYNYLGSGPVSTSTVIPFIPYDFIIEVSNNGAFANTHTGGATDFTYVGESFGFSTNPQFTVTAVAYCGTPPCPVTANYSGSWASKVNGAATTLPTTDLTGTDNTVNWTVGAIGYTPGDFVAGISTVTFDASTAYTKPVTPLAPYTNNIDPAVTVTFTDINGITKTQSLSFNPAGNLERFGRATLTDTYGATDAVQSMIFNTEYYDGATNLWRVNTDDLTTTVSASTGLTCTPTGFTCSVDGTPAGLQVSGTGLTPGGAFTLAPTAAITGAAALTLTGPDWLKFDWDGNGTSEFSSATATFGIYRGDDRFYYWREER